jgi:hypothetical protein
MSSGFIECITSVDWTGVSEQLDQEGVAVLPSILTESACRELDAHYEDPSVAFRSTIDMGRFGFGQGQYRYFDHPLPELVRSLREQFYSPLSRIANDWSARLGEAADWPASLEELTSRCAAAGQQRPTPLLLRYGEGDYNCLHQDLYGEVRFPLQVVFLLNRPGIDFEGGELVLVEQRPRQQSRPIVVAMERGSAAIVPVKDLPRAGKRGFRRVQMRHGVSRIRSGRRTAFGLIFHDAA